MIFTVTFSKHYKDTFHGNAREFDIDVETVTHRIENVPESSLSELLYDIREKGYSVVSVYQNRNGSEQEWI